MKAQWTNAKLEKLFIYYNRKYWKGGLLAFRITIDNSMIHYGICKYVENEIAINVNKHRTATDLRSTMLHEMAHVATGPEVGPGHGTAFFNQLERLLRMGAPIRVDIPENQNPPLLNLPKGKFPLCRRALREAYANRERSIMKEIKEKRIPEEELTKEYIGQLFHDAALEGATWKKALYW